jgi:hypothetical protein
MKMVKSLLLGTAAGLVALSGAQAADLPVKAKPVQYVKICSLYGAGFYYIPGTDMCLKMGGWVRFETGYGDNGNITSGQMSANVNNRNTSNWAWRARGYITADARNQTEYGTVRSYIAIGINTNSVGFDEQANQFSANRAFIQLAGFTFGISQSFYDFYSVPATAFWGSYPASDTGDPGWEVMGYTAQFGNGLSATISAEQRRLQQLVNTGTSVGALPLAGSVTGGAYAAPGVGVAGGNVGAGAYGGWQIPDFVGNLRVDQAWGSAQIMGALHQVNAGYYGTSSGSIENSGHPSDAWGFAVGAGIKLLTPFIGTGDYFQAQVNYTQGALRYADFTPAANNYLQYGQNAAYGVLSDGVFGGSVAGGSASSVELTTAWGVNAAYEHFWNRQWKTSAYGGYLAISYDAAANAMLCNSEGSANGISGAGTLAVAAAGCDNNWQTWWVGTRTQFNVDASTYVGLDIIYQDLLSAQTRNGIVAANTIPATTATSPISVSDQGIWSFRFRVHRDFYP